MSSLLCGSGSLSLSLRYYLVRRGVKIECGITFGCEMGVSDLETDFVGVAGEVLRRDTKLEAAELRPETRLGRFTLELAGVEVLEGRKLETGLAAVLAQERRVLVEDEGECFAFEDCLEDVVNVGGDFRRGDFGGGFIGLEVVKGVDLVDKTY